MNVNYSPRYMVTGAQDLNDTLSKQGFRRSQNVLYRPSCVECAACMSARIDVSKFQNVKVAKKGFKEKYHPEPPHKFTLGHGRTVRFISHLPCNTPCGWRYGRYGCVRICSHDRRNPNSHARYRIRTRQHAESSQPNGCTG